MLTKNENISYLKTCKICGNNKLKEVIKLNEQYISATFVKSNKENNLKKIRSTLNLLLCVQNGNLNNIMIYRNGFFSRCDSIAVLEPGDQIDIPANMKYRMLGNMSILQTITAIMTLYLTFLAATP